MILLGYLQDLFSVMELFGKSGPFPPHQDPVPLFKGVEPIHRPQLLQCRLSMVKVSSREICLSMVDPHGSLGGQERQERRFQTHDTASLALCQLISFPLKIHSSVAIPELNPATAQSKSFFPYYSLGFFSQTEV